MDLYPHIFHEKQEGQLCAQHALNALLQGAYFTAVDLADIARQLDAVELEAMAEGNVGGLETAEYQRFVKEGSSNYDDSGFFSVQVISKALSVWNLGITPIRSPQASSARSNPAQECAFICNLQEHWFTLRKFGKSAARWYNLNSVYDGPEYVSETFLGLLLAQLENEGYSIFVVEGALPESEADLFASNDPIPDPSQIPKGPSKDRLLQQNKGSKSGVKASTGLGRSQEDELAAAIALSLGQEVPSDASGVVDLSTIMDDDENDEDLKRALAQSIEEGGVDSKSLQDAINASMKEDEERLMREAMEASLKRSADEISTETPNAPAEEVSAKEIRRRRLDRFSTPQ
ncbi:ataxin 3 [Phlyctochytrium arcticum]|nr:ataxin 3 [Phlyctochytrium arcticum]